MRLWIRKSDLNNANYCNHEDCFLARALKRKFPKATDISVGPYDAELKNGKKLIHFTITGNGHDRLSNYDFYGTNEGFHVTLKKDDDHRVYFKEN